MKAEFKFGFFTWEQKSLLASALLLMPDICLHMTEVESVFYSLRYFNNLDIFGGGGVLGGGGVVLGIHKTWNFANTII